MAGNALTPPTRNRSRIMNDDTNTSYFCYSTATTGGNFTVSGEDTNTCATGNDGNRIIIYRTVYVEPPPPRRILVSMPKEWSREKLGGWVDLINQKTRTGWIVEMMMFGGEIVICDPNIERRTFDEFLALLLWRASENDKALINEFVKTA